MKKPVYPKIRISILLLFLISFYSCSDDDSPTQAQGLPNNFLVAFNTFNLEGGSVISTINPDGTDRRNLADTISGQNTNPTWSPDGERIAFISDRTGSSELFIMNRDGSNAVQITNSGGFKFSLSWSPFEDRLLYAQFENDLTQVFTSSTNSDFPNIFQMTNNVQGSSTPLWSPDGNTILFTSPIDSTVVFRTGNTTYAFSLATISVIEANGTGRTNLTTDPAILGSSSWSPDGQRIAYSLTSQILVDSSNNSLEMQSDIFTIDADDGLGKNKLTNSSLLQNYFNAEYSPNGTRILAIRTRFKESDLVIMNTDGSNLRVIDERPFEITRAIWSPDGLRIIYLANQNNVNSIFIINATGTNAQNLTEASNFVGGLSVSPLLSDN